MAKDTIDKIPKGTIKLLDQEAFDAAVKRVLIQKVALEIEQIFLREDMTIGDFAAVFALFMGRADRVFEKTKIKTIKEKNDL